LKEPVFVPPVAVAREAKRGLTLRRGLSPSRRCGTKAGLCHAVRLKNRQPLSLSVLKQMSAYFDRHEGDSETKGWGINSKGWQAWLLWGGDAGRGWAESCIKTVEDL
jgi:hypothetical protein